MDTDLDPGRDTNLMEEIPPRIYEIQAGQLLGFNTLQEVVDWAVEVIVLGYDSPSLRILAGLQEPLDDLEINRLLSKVSEEFNIVPVSAENSISYYIAPIIRKAIKGELTQKEALEWLKELCLAENFNKELMNFYLLYHAQSELETFGEQWYWKGATSENIDQIIHDYFQDWLKSHDKNTAV